MGFAVNNSRAVLEGLFKRKSEFVRTPKYSIQNKKDTWRDKTYTPVKISGTVVLEVFLAAYCLIGVVASIYFLEIAAVPFQLMFFLGFTFVSGMSLKHAFLARRLRAEG